MHELYKKYRPKTYKGLVGQPDAVKVLTEFNRTGRYPHAVLLTGPSGCGKTTTARIIKEKISCSDIDFNEINVADFKGIDTVRDIRKSMGLAPMGGKARMWLLDECHSLTGDAQNALLKVLEDPPSHAYFALATTDPAKLKPTIKTRCTEVRFRPLKPPDMARLLEKVLNAEGKKLSEEVVEKIVNAADGSARQALVMLEQVVGLKDEESMISAIQAAGHVQATDLVFQMLNGAKWAVLSKTIKAIDEEPEKLRRMVLTIAMNTLLSGGKNAPRAAAIITAFSLPFFDTGKPGLTLAAYEVCTG